MHISACSFLLYPTGYGGVCCTCRGSQIFYAFASVLYNMYAMLESAHGLGIVIPAIFELIACQLVHEQLICPKIELQKKLNSPSSSSLLTDQISWRGMIQPTLRMRLTCSDVRRAVIFSSCRTSPTTRSPSQVTHRPVHPILRSPSYAANG